MIETLELTSFFEEDPTTCIFTNKTKNIILKSWCIEEDTKQLVSITFNNDPSTTKVFAFEVLLIEEGCIYIDDYMDNCRYIAKRYGFTISNFDSLY